MFDRGKWRGNSIPVKANTVVALRNRSLGVRGWNQPHSPLHHFADRAIDHRPMVNEKFDLPSRTRTTFITAFSNDNSLLASCHGNHNTHILDVKTRKVVRSLSGHARSPWCVTFHPKTNEIVATGSLNGEVRVWDLRGDGSESWTLELPDEDQVAIASLSFHPYDHVLAIAGGNEIYFWDWSLPQPFASVKTNTKEERVRLVRFDPWGHSIITGVGGVEDDEVDHDSDSDPLPSMPTASLLSNQPVDDGDNTQDYSRREISETHQRILHARVSVNEEIRQQYTRLQRLRQERHRLEMRLRELQDSANEVRNSTPPLPQPEASFVENQSLIDHDVAFIPYAASIANSQQPTVLDDHLRSLEAGPQHDNPSQNPFAPSSQETIDGTTPITSSNLNDNAIRRPNISISPPPQTAASIQASRARSFRERLQAIYRRQSNFPSATRTTSQILSQLRQRRIQRELSPRPNPYPSHLSSTYFQPRIAPYVFFPDLSTETASAEEQPSDFAGRPRMTPPRERVLRPVTSIIMPPTLLNSSIPTPTEVRSEAARHRNIYETFFPPSVGHEAAMADVQPLDGVLEQIPIPDTEMFIEFGGHSQETESSTSEHTNNLTRSSLLSADPMWNSEPPFMAEPESLLLPDTEIDPWSHLTLRTRSPTLLARRRREQSLRRTVGTSAMLRRWFYSDTTESGRSAAHSRASVIQSTSSGASTSHGIPSGGTLSESRQDHTEASTDQTGSTGSNSTNRPNPPSTNNQEQPGTSQSNTQSNSHATENSSVAAAHSLSDAVNSLIEAADNLNEAADNLLHDASASAASVLLDDSDSSSSDGAPDAQPVPSVPSDTQPPASRMPSVFPHRRPPSLRRSSLRATFFDLERDRRRRASRATSQRPFRPRHSRWQPASRHLDQSSWVRTRRFTPSTSRRLSGSNSINRIISDVYAEHHGHRSTLLGHDRIVYRLQYWNFSKLQLPEICSYRKNVIVESCKIYNDTSVDISRDGRVIAVFIPTADIMHSTLSRPMEVAVISLQPRTFGQILFRKGCEHNLVCLSISPLCNRICVGFRYRHCLIGESRTSKILMGHVFAMADDEEMPLVQKIYHPAERNIRLVSINTMSWSPQAGGGLAYGTNTGDVRIVSISPSDDSQLKSEMSRL